MEERGERDGGEGGQKQCSTYSSACAGIHKCINI